MKNLRLIAVVVGTLLGAASPLCAQLQDVHPDTRVRVRTRTTAAVLKRLLFGPLFYSGHGPVGHLVEQRGDTAFISFNGMAPSQVVLSPTRYLEIPAGYETHPWEGAAVGAGVGAGTGFAVVALVCFSEASHQGGWAGLDCPIRAGSGALIGIVVGAGVGAVVGGNIRTERWGPLSRSTLGIAPGPRGGIAVAVSFPL